MRFEHLCSSRCYILFHYLVLLTLVHFPIASLGQDQTRTRNQADAKTPNRVPRVNIYQVLEHARRLSDDARGLKPLDETQFQARLADAVWPFDQSLAERLLLRSFELTIALLKDSPRVDFASRSADPQMLFAHISSIAAKHDEKLGNKLRERWQEALASVAEKGNELKSDPAQMAYLLLTQSANHLKSDDQKARQLFRQSVSQRVVQDHSFFLMNQRKRAPEIADILFSDTLDVLARRPLLEANEILVLSSYLFSPNDSVAYVVISGYNTANAAGNASAIPKNPALAKRYLELLLTKMDPDERIPLAVAYFALKNLLPQYQLLAPELLNSVYAKMGNLAPNVSKDDSAAFDYSHNSSSASESEATADWEKRIQKADKLEPEDRRDLEYFTIVFGYLLPKQDFTRAALIVNRISNQELKEKSGDILNLTVLQTKLDTLETASSVSESDCSKMKAALVRVVALSSLGRARLKQKATGDALRLFDEAFREANQIKDDQDRIQAKLMLAQLALSVDSAVGLAQAVAAFKEINQFSNFNVNKSAFSLPVTVYGLNNQLPINSPAPSSLLSAVATMCRVDCQETLHTSALLEKKEVRLWAGFIAVQTALRESSREPKRSMH